MTEKIGFSEVDERYEGASEKTSSGSFTEYAGFWRRAAAFILDGLLISFVVGAIAMVLQLFNVFDGLSKKEIDWVKNSIELFMGWIYFAKMESSSLQGTYGKHILKMKVTDVNGDRITFGRASIRHFAKFVSAIILFFGFIMVAFMKKKQGLHDTIADTVVVRK